MRSASRSVPILAVILLASTAAPVANPVAPQTATAATKAWHFDVTPYLWGVGLDGEVKVGRLPAGGVEASFSDLVEVLDLALMGAFEARRERYGILVEAFYTELSENVDPSDPAFGEVDAELDNEFYTLAGSYRVLDGKTTLDILAGARYTSLKTSLELSGGVASGRTVSDDQSWWDGFAGLHVVFHAERWFIAGYGDLGAGGSDLTWQVVAGGGYEFTRLLALKFGYRYLSYDYENDDFLYDMAMAGPYMGLGFRF